MKKLSSLQFCAMEYFLILANNVGLTTYILFNYAKQDALISIILGTILGFIPLSIYLKILNTKPELNIFEKIEDKFKTGKLINLIITLTIIFLTSINYNNLINFISSQYLSKTPKIIITLSFLPAIIYILNKGTTVIGRTVFILLMISASFVTLTILGLIWQIKLDNLLPILEQGIKNPIICSLIYVTYNITPLFLLTVIPKNEISDKEKLNKRMIITYITANIIILIMFFLILSILGPNLSNLYQYPEYDVLKKVSLIGFIERTESTISLRWTFYVLTVTIMGILFITKYIKHTIKIKNEKTNKKIVLIISTIIVLLGNYIFKNKTSFNEITSKTLPIISTIILIIIPIIINIKKTNKT
jgi:spore germination protein KB